MVRTLDFRDRDGDYRAAMPRASFDVDAATEAVRPVCQGVAERGVDALREYSQAFDHVVPDSFRVSAQALRDAEAALDDELRQAFGVAIQRRRAVARAEQGESEIAVTLAPGAVVAQRLVPVSRVGLYVPGGLAPLASSVLMNVIPAQVAGVSSIAVASPPQAAFGGLPHPSVLAVCAMLGVDEVYAVGGAQAVAMFAYGVPGVCERVEMVTGPGNIYVVAAKRLLRGIVGIDSEAGPTEIAILADESANAAWVAADLISQAEHDPMAGAVLVTDSTRLAGDVAACLDTQVATTKHAARIRESLGGPQSAVILVRDVEQGLAVVDAYAAEHLEIQTRDAQAVAARVRNAGAIFVGPYSPVPLGDYCAGSTHVLPTGGSAAYSSGLNVKSFQRAVHVISYDADGLAGVAGAIEAFAAAEDLPAHAASIAVRRAG